MIEKIAGNTRPQVVVFRTTRDVQVAPLDCIDIRRIYPVCLVQARSREIKTYDKLNNLNLRSGPSIPPSDARRQTPRDGPPSTTIQLSEDSKKMAAAIWSCATFGNTINITGIPTDKSVTAEERKKKFGVHHSWGYELRLGNDGVQALEPVEVWYVDVKQLRKARSGAGD